MKTNLNTKSLIVQILFWTGFWIINFIDELAYSESGYSLILASFIYTASILLLVYLNILWIIPRFLYKKKYLLYVVILLLVTILLVSINYKIDIGWDYSFLEVIEKEISYLVFDFIQMLLSVGGISSVWIIVEQLRTREKLVLSEKKQTLTSLKFLKAQTNPHFLFNVLNNVHFLIDKDPEKASQTLFKLSDILRYQLYETDTEVVSIEKEIQHIKSYIELEKIRMGDRLDLNATFDCSCGALNVAPFLLLPLVENAFKHSSGKNASIISLSLKVTSEEVDLKIENSFSHSVDEKNRKGLGISNLKERLELLYPGKHVYTYETKEGMYISHLKLSL